MSPRKERYEVSKHVVQSIRDKRKKILSGPYICPKCGQEKVRIKINNLEKKATAICVCGLNQDLVFKEGVTGPDYYNELIDILEK